MRGPGAFRTIELSANRQHHNDDLLQKWALGFSDS